ncbi:hypothetical protein Agub_g1091 [Astrephomene gubernaculifera]|uniref:Uncharacterized protein n=1 Tax=Astrephomene gubernaculifera TaxID=47775 RepID=A0AAD3HH10_9CHLO|nr:hypothetical protein Agub_g1091 [Astrephomene gubernaculifera]
MSLQRRISAGSSRLGSADGTAVLSRSNSVTGLTDENVKSASQRFDVEIVFKLTWANKGLTRLAGLEKCANIVELNLAGNQISKIEGLEMLLQLRRLVLSSNRIGRVEGLSQLKRLEVLWLQDNRVATLEALALPHLAELPALRALYLQNIDRSAHNAVCRVAGYKAAVLAALPKLTNLDGERLCVAPLTAPTPAALRPPPRSPASINYAELAAEYDAFRANPPPPKEVVLPTLTPWLAGVSTEVAMGGGPGEAALQQRHAKVVKDIDECEVLVQVLKDAVSKFKKQVEERKKEDSG